VLDRESDDGGYYDSAVHCAAAAAEEQSFWASGRNKLIVWSVRTYFPEARSLFEVGCGTGIVLRALRDALPRLELSGGDWYRPALEEARRKLPGVELVEVDALRLPFQEQFDVLAALDVLEHVDDDEAVLREIYRATRTGGGVLITVPQHAWLWSAADDWAEHRRRYNRGELVAKLTASGFDLVRVTSFVSLLLPLMVVARLVSRRRKSYDPVAELRLPRSLDAALGSVLALEAVAIERGMSFPAGGSLLAIARKR